MEKYSKAVSVHCFACGLNVTLPCLDILFGILPAVFDSLKMMGISQDFNEQASAYTI